ncbi:MAG: class II aldolase/adducin family protein [Nitrospirae bacterium YQR-1]
MPDDEDIERFVRMSRYAGERFDLIQGNGGNSSVKLSSGQLLIKASGRHLSEVQKNTGYVTLETHKALDVFELLEAGFFKCDKSERDVKISIMLNGLITQSQGERPSIETLLHALTQKYTLHTHPVVVNAALCKGNWAELLSGLFPDAGFVTYETPGAGLAVKMKNALKGQHKKIIFLQNHGLIVTSDIYGEIETLTETVLEKLESYFSVNYSRYKLTTKLSALINKLNGDYFISSLSEDIGLNSALAQNRGVFFKKPFFPDMVVFCGAVAAEISDFDDHKSIENHYHIYGEIPRVVICGDNIFFTAPSVKKTKEMEEVLKLHVFAHNAASENINYLDTAEIGYILNWEAEKYRQNK